MQHRWHPNFGNDCMDHYLEKAARIHLDVGLPLRDLQYGKAIAPAWRQDVDVDKELQGRDRDYGVPPCAGLVSRHDGIGTVRNGSGASKSFTSPSTNCKKG